MLDTLTDFLRVFSQLLISNFCGRFSGFFTPVLWRRVVYNLDFNVVFRDDPASEVVAFTATQIPGIAGRRYPPELAGPAYPAGIPIVPEAELEVTIAAHGVRRVVFAYSDVSHERVMHIASQRIAHDIDRKRAHQLRPVLPAADVGRA